MDITEREFMTKAKLLPQQKHLQLMDEILAEEIPNIEEQHRVDTNPPYVVFGNPWQPTGV